MHSAIIWLVFYLRDAMLARYDLWPYVCPYACPSVYLSQAGIVSKRLNRSSLFFGAQATLGSSYTTGNSGISKVRALPSETVPNSGLKNIRHGTSTVANVVKLVRPTTDASLSRWASTFVYNTMDVTQRVAWVGLRQLRLVLLHFCSSFYFMTYFYAPISTIVYGVL